MADNIVFSKESLLDVTTDPVGGLGDYSIDGTVVTLPQNAYVKYTKTFDTENNKLQTKALRFTIVAKSEDQTLSTRYKDNIRLDAYIQYYKEITNEDGEITGYEDGELDLVSILPYLFSERIDGWVISYDIDIREDLIKSIEITLLNAFTSDIQLLNPQIFPGMTVMEAIEKYVPTDGGGGSGGSGGGATILEDLVLYSLSGVYTIGTNEYLDLKVMVPLKYFTTAGTNILAASWGYTTLSGVPQYTTALTQTPPPDKIDGANYYVNYGVCRITATGTSGVIRVRVQVSVPATGEIAYAEKDVIIDSYKSVGFKLVVDSEDGKIHGVEGTDIYIYTQGLTPNTARYDEEDIYVDVGQNLSTEAAVRFDGNSEIKVNNYVYLKSGVAHTKLHGNIDGELRLLLRGKSFFLPTGHEQEFIVEVVESNPTSVYMTNTDYTIPADGTENVFYIESDTGILIYGEAYEILDGDGKMTISLPGYYSQAKKLPVIITGDYEGDVTVRFEIMAAGNTSVKKYYITKTFTVV